MATMMANAGHWKNRQNNFGNNNTAMTNYEPQHPRGPPVNPRANYYLVVCYVCQEMAKPNQEHSLHYGGIVCFSCRAFFRRAHQVYESVDHGIYDKSIFKIPFLRLFKIRLLEINVAALIFIKQKDLFENFGFMVHIAVNIIIHNINRKNIPHICKKHVLK